MSLSIAPDPYRWSRPRFPFLLGLPVWGLWGYFGSKLISSATESLTPTNSGLLVMGLTFLIVITIAALAVVTMVFRNSQRSLKFVETDDSGKPGFRMETKIHGHQLALSGILLAFFVAFILLNAAFSTGKAIGLFLLLLPGIYMSIYRIVALVKLRMRFATVIDSESITIGDASVTPWNRFLWRDIEAILFSSASQSKHFRIKIRRGASRPNPDVFTRIQLGILWISGYPAVTMPLRFFDLTQEELTDAIRRTAPWKVHVS